MQKAEFFILVVKILQEYPVLVALSSFVRSLQFHINPYKAGQYDSVGSAESIVTSLIFSFFPKYAVQYFQSDVIPRICIDRAFVSNRVDFCGSATFEIFDLNHLFSLL